MPKFIFAYHGGKTPETPEEGAAVMAAWRAWFDGIGDAMVEPGAPFGQSRTVTLDGVAEGGGANPVNGYTVIKVADIDAASEIAKGCPMVLSGSGSVEVAELTKM